MKNKNNVFVVLFSMALFVLIFSFSCQPPAVKSSDSSTNNLPVKTIQWQDDGTGFIQYYTNDVNNCNMGFFTNINQIFNPMQSVEILKKNSGSQYFGYGIIFCAQDSNNFYRILIAANGYFNIYKKVSGTYTMITDWTFSSSLNQGYNVINDIKVTRDCTGTFTLYFNSNSIGSTNDTTFTGGDCGYYASVGTSDYESFPNTPVDVRFKYIPSSSKDITSFSFTAALNSGLFSDCVGTISGTNISVLIPNSANINNLIATFVTNGASVKIGSVIQNSGTTSNNFTTPVTYTVTADDGTTQNFIISVFVVQIFGISGAIAVDSSLNIYVANNSDYVQKFDSKGNFLLKWGGSLGMGNGQFNVPCGIAIDGLNNVYVADTYNNRIQKFDSSGNYITQWGSYVTGGHLLYEPGRIVIDISGNIYISDFTDGWIQKFDSNGNYITRWGSSGSSNSQFTELSNIATDGSYIYAIDANNNVIQKFDSSGNYISQWGWVTGSSNGQMMNPQGLVVDSSGNIYIADYENNRIQKFDSSGNFLTTWGCLGSGYGQFNRPAGIYIDKLNNIYIVDTENNRIQKFTQSYISSLSSSLSSSISLSKINLNLGKGSSNKWNGSEGIKNNISVIVNKKN